MWVVPGTTAQAVNFLIRDVRPEEGRKVGKKRSEGKDAGGLLQARWEQRAGYKASANYCVLPGTVLQCHFQGVA
jgi:hypothetical protein